MNPLKEFFKTLYSGWLKVAHAIGRFNTLVILSFMFYFIFFPVSIVARILRKDPLRIRMKPVNDSYWIPRERREIDMEFLRKQY